MCSLKLPFDASTLSGLVVKITRGEYEEIPKQYSADLRALVTRLLSVDPQDRPDINQVLKLKFLKPYIETVLISFEQVRRERIRQHLEKHPAETQKLPKEIEDGNTIAELIESKLAVLENKLGADKLALLYSSVKVTYADPSIGNLELTKCPRILRQR